MGLKDVQVSEVSLVEELQSISEAVNNYVSDEKYSLDIEDPDHINDIFIENKVLDIVCDELLVLGIKFQLDRDEMIMDGAYRYLIFHLRKMFDRKLLLTDLRNAPDNVCDEINSLLMGDFENGYEYFIDDFSEIMYKNYPTNVGWQTIIKYLDLVESDTDLYAHINALMKLRDKEGSGAVVNEYNVEAVTAYIRNRTKHVHEVTVATNYMLKSFSELDRDYILKNLNVHDRDLIANGKVNLRAVFFGARQKDENAVDFIDIAHHESQNHHWEYYVKNNITPNINQQVMLIADVYKYKDGKARFIEKVIDIVKEGKFNDDVKESMLRLASVVQFDYANATSEFQRAELAG